MATMADTPAPQPRTRPGSSLSFDANRLVLLAAGGFRLIGQKCGACGTVAVGRHQRCLKCHSGQKEEIDLTPSGVVSNYTQVNLAPSSAWKGPVPYTLVEARLPEGPVLTTYILGVKEAGAVKVGMPVKLDISKADTDEKGNDVYIYVWKPA